MLSFKIGMQVVKCYGYKQNGSQGSVCVTDVGTLA